MEFEIGDGAGWGPDVLPVHPADNTNERSRSRKDVLYVDFLIGNFRPLALNKTHIVCARIQAQLPEPRRIKDLVRGGFTLLRFLLVKVFHGWVFSQLRHECSPLCGRSMGVRGLRKRQLHSASHTPTGTSFFDIFQSFPLMKSGARRRKNASCFDCPGRISSAPALSEANDCLINSFVVIIVMPSPP